jgi:hypothetical protein
MILGMSLETFTIVHVIISLIAIASGLFVLYQMLNSRFAPGWTALFLATTVLTSVTGFMFPISSFTPGLGFGVISLVVLSIALYALYGQRFTGAWRWLYVVTAIFALYLNTFVLVVQSFQKIAVLNALASGSELPFAIAQGIVLIVFLALGYLGVCRFRVR